MILVAELKCEIIVFKVGRIAGKLIEGFQKVSIFNSPKWEIIKFITYLIET